MKVKFTKVVSVFLTIIMLVSMVACASNNVIHKNEGSTKKTTSKQTTSKKETTKRPTTSKNPTTDDSTTTKPSSQNTSSTNTSGDVTPGPNKVTPYDEVNAHYIMNIDTNNVVHNISDLLYGIFFEDINFAADGGLYAEMVINRSFEFTELATNDALHGWKKVGNCVATVKVDDKKNALNENNTNYLVINNALSSAAGLANVGYLDGMSIIKNAKYNFSIYAKGLNGYTGKITVNLMVGNDVVASSTINSVSSSWQKYELTLTPNATATSNVTLQVLIDKGSAAIDMVSLFPDDTYKGRKNGLRKDLCELLEGLEPRFLRFPGGCVIEGYDAETAYDWKDSIGTGSDGKPLYFNNTYGDVAARSQGISIWTDINATEDKWPSFFSYGLGFFEYFQLAEDIGAIGVPVVNCGLYCQARGRKPVPIDSDEFKQYIQDALDLVEFCRGDETTTWGKVRVALGHKEPFELKYIGIGNENFNQDYFDRYVEFVKAFAQAKVKNPKLFEGIEIMYSAGVDDGISGPDYLSSYEYAKKWLEANPGASIDDFAGATDHHYYNEPEWFLENSDYYDEENYKRNPENMIDTLYGGAIKVFLGEYAARSNTLKAALAEAAYMTGLERNGDIVVMAAYAPLFCNSTAYHWAPDLIWFNNHQSVGSINYYVQKIFSTNAGTKLLKTTMENMKNISANKEVPLSGKVGVATWFTSAKFDNIKIVNNDTGEVLASDNFSSNTSINNWELINSGSYKVQDGALVQTDASSNGGGDIGSVAYFGNVNWSNYTYTLDATKLSGEEAFLIPFAVQDKANNIFWNIGGWGNKVSALQQVSNGSKTDAIPGTKKTFEAETGKTYSLKIVVSGRNVKCYIDNVLYVDYTFKMPTTSDVYQVVSTDDSGDVIIKLVNVSDKDQTFAINLEDFTSVSGGTVYQVAGTSLKNDNVLGKEEKCTMKELNVSGFSEKFNYTVPKYSVTVIRIHP